jgi:hypothetical protein
MKREIEFVGVACFASFITGCVFSMLLYAWGAIFMAKILLTLAVLSALGAFLATVLWNFTDAQ